MAPLSQIGHKVENVMMNMHIVQVHDSLDTKFETPLGKSLVYGRAVSSLTIYMRLTQFSREIKMFLPNNNYSILLSPSMAKGIGFGLSQILDKIWANTQVITNIYDSGTN